MAKTIENSPVFNTERRLKLGIWGLGRGMSFYKTCEMLNFDVVAGCDYNAHMREHFLECNPGAFATADAAEFLASDIDAVLLATFCPAHADDALQCLAAGKHVLSEVTAFHNMAEGVRLVEAVEQSGLVYNLAENYPFTAPNMYLARKWQEGLFGELMYAEYEYVHECRSLCYTYIDGKPVEPGNTVHSWRSWLNYHYYCTHSLGPVMVITGERPTRVTAMPGKQLLAGYLVPRFDEQTDGIGGMGGVTPSLIQMSNGSIVSNLMGATTNDSHVQRIWGTRGAAEINVGKNLQLRLGASGGSPKFEVTPHWDALGEMAASTGHGGGDFWVLYYFARQILQGNPAPFDIYSAADVTIPGIQALRSAVQGGEPMAVPDFRDPAQRQQYRNDDWQQPRYDTRKGVFPVEADLSITQQFAATMTELIRYSLSYRAYADWAKVEADLIDPERLADLLEGLIAIYPQLQESYASARKLIDAYPASDGARVLREMLQDIGDEATVMAPGFLDELRRRQQALRQKYPFTRMLFTQFVASALLPVADVRTVAKPRASLKLAPVPYDAPGDFADVRTCHGGKDGLLIIRSTIELEHESKGQLRFGADGPVKVWLNGKAVACEPTATNPATHGEYGCKVTWKPGPNTVTFALYTNKGNAWGVNAVAVFDK